MFFCSQLYLKILYFLTKQFGRYRHLTDHYNALLRNSHPEVFCEKSVYWFKDTDAFQ